MAERTMTQTNSYGDLLTWITSAEVEANYDPDEDRGDDESTCATCEQTIEAGARYWHCIDTGDDLHEGCGLPDW